MSRNPLTCSACNGRGSGENPLTGPWTCGTCGGRGRLPQLRRVRRSAKWEGMLGSNLPQFPNLPPIMDRFHRVLGYVVFVFDDGINVEHWDGHLWSFYKWEEVHNADEIKAEWKRIYNG